MIKCVIFDNGGTLVGLQAGIAAGMTTFFYNPHHHTTERKAVVHFQDMADLPHLLAKY